ncbi:MAG: 7,8-didemethyl-8-hydroxy-5-deazariboflavin synthase CofG [Terriglobales bacterium]
MTVFSKETDLPAALDFDVRGLEKLGDAPIPREVARGILRSGDELLPALLAAAQSARNRFKPGIITYSRKVFLPLTNLCRDYCGYCTFRRDAGEPGAHTMIPDEVMEVVRTGERMGCTEALFSLGDKPELLFPEMRETLRHLGYKSTLHYLEAMCEKVLRESNLLPHPNPGLMSAEWLARLAHVAPSVGLMLETTSTRLLAKNAAHDDAPDKEPAKRLRVIEDAGRQKIPFTTGILIGIGETMEERVDALAAIRDLHNKYGHIQEVIVQNFCAKPATPMASWSEPSRNDMLRTLAVARLMMPAMNIQAPPNLSDPHYTDLLDGGINDWGGISPLTPDFINPEKPWPHLDQLRERTLAKGFQLRQRLPVYSEFVAMAEAKGDLLAQRVLSSQLAVDRANRHTIHGGEA